MNNIVARRLRKKAFEETGDLFRSDRQEYTIHVPDSRMALFRAGKCWGTLVTKGGRHLYRLLKKKYKEDRRNGN